MQENQQKDHWFSPDLVYEGDGRIDLINPKGHIIGKMIVRCNDLGQYSVTTVKDFKLVLEENNTTGIDGHIWLTYGEIATTSNFYPSVMPSNKASKFTLTTTDGILTSEGEIDYRPLSLVSRILSITLYPDQLIFESHNQPSSPTYWVMPLLNFITPFSPADSTLMNHPLRIYPFDFPNNFSSLSDIEQSNWLITLSQRMVTFDYASEKGFIEALPNYYQARESLTDGSVKVAVTSIIVGKVDSAIDNGSGVVPLQFLPLLSIANGNPVEESWIEYRDEKGLLLKRIHNRSYKPSYEMIPPILDKNCQGGLSVLITSGLSSPHYQNMFLRKAMSQLLESYKRNHDKSFDINNIFYHAYIALALLSKLAGTNRVVNYYANLDQPAKDVIDNAVDQAFDTIQKEASSNATYSYDLTQVAKKIKSVAKSVDKNFGQEVKRLLDHHHLSDESIVGRLTFSYANCNITWLDAISSYRNIIAHDGYIDEDGMVEIAFHLQDITTRILLKVLDYKGTYRPRIRHLTDEYKELNWVDAAQNITPKDLGYL